MSRRRFWRWAVRLWLVYVSKHVTTLFFYSLFSPKTTKWIPKLLCDYLCSAVGIHTYIWLITKSFHSKMLMESPVRFVEGTWRVGCQKIVFLVKMSYENWPVGQQVNLLASGLTYLTKSQPISQHVDPLAQNPDLIDQRVDPSAPLEELSLPVRMYCYCIWRYLLRP